MNIHYDLTVRDPYYQHIPINNAKTKFKKIPHKLPDNLSNNDQQILKKFKTKAYRYDMWFNLIGVPFGISNLIQLIPVAGVIITTYQSIRLLWLTTKLTNGFPVDLYIYSLGNIVIDLVLGLIPIVGDLISVSYKANLRNYALLLDHLHKVSDYNNGIIDKTQIRPNFINNRINWFKESPGIELQSLKSPSHSGSISSFKSGTTTGVSTATKHNGISINSDSISIGPKGVVSSKSLATSGVVS